ncbi:MAG TPA: CoA pyrophosphatase, partial [Caulobacterales bacterium]|nr:CoA pyrophosphatase [Caulobacterales bacterium]
MIDDADFEARLRARLDPLDALAQGAPHGDFELDPSWAPPAGAVIKPAAVLAPIVKRESGWTMLFTQRAHDLPTHAGQISFPGGRIEAGESPLAAALRETEEEIGLGRALVDPVGGWNAYETGTGFRIVPIAGLVTPEFMLTLDAREVAETFEVPVRFLFDAANHERREGEWRGRRSSYWVMPYQDRFIWGATAGMIRALYER